MNLNLDLEIWNSLPRFFFFFSKTYLYELVFEKTHE